MKVGFTAVDITPKIGTPIAGNIRADNLTHGVYHEIYSRTACFFDGRNYYAFSSVEICAIRTWQVEEVRRIVSEKTPIPPENITVSAMHTHSGPTMGAFEEKTHETHIQPVIDGIAESIVRAFTDLSPVTFRIGRATNDQLPHNRRVWTRDGVLHMNWEKFAEGELEREAGPIDPEILVLTAYDENESLKGILVNYTLHPAVLAGDNNLTSADYVGFLARNLTDTFPSSPQFVYINGAAGNINHLNPWDPNQVRGFEEAARIGNTIAEEVKKAIANSVPVEVETVTCIRKELDVPRREITPEKIAWAQDILDKWDGSPISLVDGFPDEAYAQATMELAKFQTQPIRTEVQIVRLGPITLVALPGEFFVEYGLRLKKLFGEGRTMIADLANGSIGYIPTVEAFDEGGYETTLGHQSKLVENAGELFMKCIDTIR